jgi:hypothetical protein
VARLAGRFAPALFSYALSELEAKGYVTPASPATADAASDPWWSAHDIAPKVARPLSLVRSTELVDAGADSIRHDKVPTQTHPLSLTGSVNRPA